MEPHKKVAEEEEEELGCPSLSSSSNFMDDEDDGDDATSPIPPLLSSSSSSSPPIFGMSKLMAELPIKRGLSRHFDGKSQSFTSLSKVECLEDLVKPCKRLEVVKQCRRSYGGGLDVRHRIITKKRDGKHGSLSYLGDLKRSNASMEGKSGGLTNGTLLYA